MPTPSHKEILLLNNAMFAMAVYSFLNFLFRHNPHHLADFKLAISIPVLFFAFAYAGSRFTGRFVFVVASSLAWISVGGIIVAIYPAMSSFNWNTPVVELIAVNILFLVLALGGSCTGLLLFRRATKKVNGSADGGNGA